MLKGEKHVQKLLSGGCWRHVLMLRRFDRFYGWWGKISSNTVRALFFSAQGGVESYKIFTAYFFDVFQKIPNPLHTAWFQGTLHKKKKPEKLKSFPFLRCNFQKKSKLCHHKYFKTHTKTNLILCIFIFAFVASEFNSQINVHFSFKNEIRFIYCIITNDVMIGGPIRNLCKQNVNGSPPQIN